MKASDRNLAMKALSARRTRINSKNSVLHSPTNANQAANNGKHLTLSTKSSAAEASSDLSSCGSQSPNGKTSFNEPAAINSEHSSARECMPISPIKPGHSLTEENEGDALDSWSDCKKSIILPNGSSLRDVYEHKRVEIWGKIARSQARDDKKQQDDKTKRKVDSEKNYMTKLEAHIEIHQAGLMKEKEEDERASIMGLEWATKWENRQKSMTKRKDDLALEFRNKAEEDIKRRSDILANERGRRLRSEKAYAHGAVNAMKEELQERSDEKERQKRMMDDLKVENDQNIQRHHDERLLRLAEEKHGEKIMLQPQDPKEKRLCIMRKSIELANENFQLAENERKRIADIEEAEEVLRIKYDSQRWEAIEKREHDKIERRRLDSIKQVSVLNQQLKIKESRAVNQRVTDLEFGKLLVAADRQHVEREAQKQVNKGLVRDKYIRDIEVQVTEARHRKFLEIVGEMSPREVAWQKSVLDRAEVGEA